MNDPQFDVGHKPEDPVLNPYEAGFTAEPPPRSQRGCLFYGCVIASVVGVLGLLCAGALVYLGYYYYSQMIQQWTATTPVPLPKVVLPDDQRKTLDERFAAFKKALDDGDAADLVLTADEINALIDENKELKGKVYVTIDGDTISGQLSIPLDFTGFPGTKGRYFNGSGRFSVSLEDGDLVVIARDLEANGKKLPEDVKRQLAKENLAKNFMTDPDTYKYVRKFDSIKIKDGKVYIKAHARIREEPSADEKDKDKDKEKSKDDDADKAKDSEKPEPKASPRPDEPKAETPEPDTPKADAPKAEAPKAEAPRAETPKADAPAPKADAPRSAA